MKNERALFVTRLGGIFAAVGSAVGLGNIWRFPYETGTNGGAAFLLIYLACVLLLGTPLMMAELTIGKTARCNAVQAFERVSPPKLKILGRFVGLHMGYMGALCMLLIVGFYSVVAGWTLHFTTNAALGEVPEFGHFSQSLGGPFLWMTIFFLINGGILLGGVRKGIERASNILMPLLALMLVALCINSLMLPGSGEGLKFLFHPDFSKITPTVIVSALGQSFFSISIGICCLLTYGSYLPNDTRMGRTSLSITLLDTLIAILAGIIIFPACFAFGKQPDAGPGLAFITLPDVFQQMPGGMVWCFLFFLLLAVAALTSSLSMLETPISILQERFGMRRWSAVLLSTGIGWTLGVLCCFSLCPDYAEQFSIFGYSIFDAFDSLTANILMPMGGLILSLFVGWVMDKKLLRTSLHDGWYYRPLIVSLRYVAPLCILWIFLHGLGWA